MKLTIDVADQGEADAITTALADPEVRAFMLVMGALLPFTPRARNRIMGFVTNAIDEELELEEDIQLEEQETR